MNTDSPFPSRWEFSCLKLESQRVSNLVLAYADGTHVAFAMAYLISFECNPTGSQLLLTFASAKITVTGEGLERGFDLLNQQHLDRISEGGSRVKKSGESWVTSIQVSPVKDET